MTVDPAFLGIGWSFPPAFAKGGADVAMASGVEDIHQSLGLLLSTRPGERAMREDFGCDLSEAMFEEIDQSLINRITGMISDAVLHFEARVSLDAVEVTANDAEQGLLLIQVQYTVRSTNSRYNLVYPFYLYEAASMA